MSGRIIDLTVTLTNNMPAHKFFPKPVIVPHFGHEEFRQWNLGIPGDQLGGATTFIGMVDHIGTHVDAFFHGVRTARRLMKCLWTCSWAKPSV